MKTSYFIIFLIIALVLAGFIGLIAYYSYTPPNLPSDKEENESISPPLGGGARGGAQQPLRPVISSTDPIRGEINAPVTLVEFSDFACPACSEIEPTLQKLLVEYQGKIRLVWKDLPNTRLHPLAQKAAESARCAQAQGKFWEYHDQLFASQGQSLSEQGFSSIAKNLNLDLDLFQQCLIAGQAAALVNRNFNEAILLKVDATPYFFINDQKISGAVSESTLRTLIETAMVQFPSP